MAKKKLKADKRSKRSLDDIPSFTGSLDAAVPAENIIYADCIIETGRWYAISQAPDGAMFAAHSHTEPNARRAAGLRTLAHLQDLSEINEPSAHLDEIREARIELARVLREAADAVVGFNEELPASRPREILIFQLRTAKEAVESAADKSVLARYVGPIACFLAGGFANGLLGKLGERALELLDKILAN